MMSSMTWPHSSLVHPFAGLPLVVCKRRQGRAAEPLPAAVAERWCTEDNGGPPPAGGRSSAAQAFFLLDCGQCKTKIQIKTAVKNQQTAFRCRQHGSEGRGLGRLQRQALEVLQQLPAAGPASAEQYRALSLAQKPVDFVLEEHKLMIEVDGEQHAQSSSGWGQAAGAQCERDRQFDRAVRNSGGRLLRLHWADVPSWLAHVQAAIQQCSQQPAAGFVFYSASYPPERRVT